MVGVFFLCENLSMDIDKLFKNVINSEDVGSVPIIFIIMVFNCVIDAISSGECFYKTEFD